MVEHVVQVHFTQELDQENDGIITTDLPGSVTFPPKAADMVERRLEVTDAATTSVALTVKPSSAGTGVEPGIGGQIEVVTTFTAGSALESGAENPLMDTEPEMEGEEPSYGETPLSSTIEGWDDEGPFRASVVITHIANDGARVVFAPIELYRRGAPHQFSIARPLEDHRVLTGSNYPVTVQLRDSLRQRLSELPTGHVLVLEGSNAAATAILADEQPAMGDFRDNARSVDRAATATEDAFTFNIAIKSDATSGDYVVNLSVKESAADDADTVGTPLAIPIKVIGAPDRMDAALSPTTIDPGQTLMVTGGMFTDAMGESAYVEPCDDTATMELTTPTPGSDCDWSGESQADRDVLTGGMGSLRSDGTADIVVKSSAGPGTYTLVVSDGRGLADSTATSKELEFTVRGRPTMYTLTGPDRIDAGDIANYTVTATDANGALPFLPPTVREVGVVLLGASGYVSTLHVDAEGTVELNDQGMATFTVVTAVNTPANTEVVIAIAGQGADPSRKTVAIGPEMLGVPTGLTLATEADDTGTVTLSWTAGANSTRHWIAGIKQEDWDANDFSNVIFKEASSNTTHTEMDLEGGKVYVFTVTAGNAAGQWSDWAPLQRITVGTPAPTGGSGPSSPFGG